MSYQVFSHSEIKVQRPTGAVETVRSDKFITPALFTQMSAATKAAGRGQLLSYENIDVAPVVSAEVRGRLEAEHAAAVALDAQYDAGRRAVTGAMTRNTY